jgi:hypothetical protein
MDLDTYVLAVLVFFLVGTWVLCLTLERRDRAA